MNNNIRYLRVTQRRRFLWRLAVSVLCAGMFGHLWGVAWPDAPEAWGAMPFAVLIFALAYGVQTAIGGWR